MFRKTLILCIDSGCWAYFQPLLSAGQMPNVARLIESGVRGILESTMPPITPVAFSSFITGTNPGKHGVFDWTVRRADGGRQSVSAAVRQGVPFWDYLNRAGVRVGVFNIPVTYPPQPIEGFLVPGITVPRRTRRLTYPTGVLDQIETRYGPYSVDVPSTLVNESEESYVSAWLKYEEMQTDAALMLMDEYEVDVLAFNYASLDRVNHLSPCRDHLETVLANVDAQIGRFVECYPDANFVIMSDHGSRRVKSAFLLSKWLALNGYAVYGEKSLDIPNHEINFALAQYFQARGLDGPRERVLRNLVRCFLTLTPSALRRPMWQAMHNSTPESVEYRFTERLDWRRTKVFATSNSGSLCINLESPGVAGGVRAGEYETVRDALIRDLLAVKDPMTGKGLFSRVYRREDLYSGAAAFQSPDVVADHYDSACDLVVDNDPGSFCFVNRLNRFGDHAREGVLVLSGPDFAQVNDAAQRASIVDLPATLLHLYGVPIPDSFDGRVLSEFLASEIVAQSSIGAQRSGAEKSSTTTDYSETELEEMTEHLKELGYL